MALTDVQQISLCQILNVMPYELTFQIGWLGNRLTDAMITSIVAKMALWDAGISDKFTRLFPKESNKGVMTYPDSARSKIRREISVLLERPDWGSSGNYLPRG